jgi:hypothetical protein
MFSFAFGLIEYIFNRAVSYFTWKIVHLRFKSHSIEKDPFKYFAGMVFNKSENFVTKSDRERAKILLFRSIYNRP